MEELQKKLRSMTDREIVAEAKMAKEYCLQNRLITIEELKEIPPRKLMGVLITRAYLHKKAHRPTV